MKNILIKEMEEMNSRIGVSVKIGERTLFQYRAHEDFDTACSVMVHIMVEYFRLKFLGKITGEEEVEYTEENYATGAGTIKFLSYGTKIKICDVVKLMIGISDHIGANLLIDFLGLENINKTILENGFINTKINHKFLIPKLKNMGTSTAEEYSEFYRKLDKKEFYSEEISKEMEEILLMQKYKDILTEKITEENLKYYIDVACKSGKADGRIYEEETPGYIADGGIIFTEKGNYYISVFGELSSKSDYGLNHLKEKIQELSREIYLNFIGGEI
ncbi:MAG: serine hydrolase [Cetobacterium sp.]|uniref:serine hydrolase n=1 Tax=Cetobacterium sp. TaxID=2071632 RepID=UPI003F391E80